MFARWRRDARVFAPVCAVGVFLVTSILPIWGTWYFNEREGLGYFQPFWIMLYSIPDTVRWVGPYEAVIELYGGNWVLVALILTAGWLFGHAWFWIAGRYSGRGDEVEVDSTTRREVR